MPRDPPGPPRGARAVAGSSRSPASPPTRPRRSMAARPGRVGVGGWANHGPTRPGGDRETRAPAHRVSAQARWAGVVANRTGALPYPAKSGRALGAHRRPWRAKAVGGVGHAHEARVFGGP